MYNKMTLKPADAQLAGDAILCVIDMYGISEFSIVVAKILNYLVEVISKCPVIMHVGRAKEPVQNGRTTAAVGAQSNSFLKQHFMQFEITYLSN